MAASNVANRRNRSETADPVIPKRGEKDFEPASEERHVNVQASLLAASRSALFSAISTGVRSHSSRAHNRAIWDNSLAKAYMVDTDDPTLPPYKYIPELDKPQWKPNSVHGIHFQTMGRYESSRKRLELLPEEALYLMERGTIECWTDETSLAVPLSLQDAWSRMLQAGGLSPEAYQVSYYTL